MTYLQGGRKQLLQVADYTTESSAMLDRPDHLEIADKDIMTEIQTRIKSDTAYTKTAAADITAKVLESVTGIHIRTKSVTKA